MATIQDWQYRGQSHQVLTYALKSAYPISYNPKTLSLGMLTSFGIFSLTFPKFATRRAKYVKCHRVGRAPSM